MRIFKVFSFPILFSIVSIVLLVMHFPVNAQTDPGELFALKGEKNIMNEEHFGIINGRITTRVNYRDVTTISGLFAPPYASSNFLLETRIFGEKVPTQKYHWYPYEVTREGEINDFVVKSRTVLTADSRAGLIVLTLVNRNRKEVITPIQLHIKGGINYVEQWEFLRPKAEGRTKNKIEGGLLVKSNEEGKIKIATDIPGLEWFDLASRWDTKIPIPAGKEVTFHIAFEMGGSDQKSDLVSQIVQNPTATVQAARNEHRRSVESIFQHLPRFYASDKRLENYYYRSLVTLLTNRWEVPEFILQPYYGSGGVIGGCVGNYLWEFGLPAQIFPLFDPKSSAENIKQFLKVDLTKYYLFNPLTGKGGGVWYQVNQDKIVELIYYYILHTGDVDFLQEKVEGLTIYEHVLNNAFFGDDLSKPITLVDYGDAGENHLELRRGYPYRGIMPDVNALRYLTYLRAYEITRLTGKPIENLKVRANALRGLLRKELWNPEHKWFNFQYNGKKDIRYTNFMYTLIGTGVFDSDIEEALLSHINEREFLGDYGIHSISKLDPAYDQDDIDHGGGGSYMAFPPLICQRLYNGGYKLAADDLLARHLWWGERLPYWGDSMPANYIGYREDTPLQSDFDSITGAQTFIFGIFGVKVNWDGKITVNPTVPTFSEEIALENLKIRGRNINIKANAKEYEVSVDGKVYKSAIGKAITF